MVKNGMDSEARDYYFDVLFNVVAEQTRQQMCTTKRS